MQKIYVFGLNLLVLNHIAQSFVLLTANVEDIKKLAKKFVSESLAEKIAEFIAKATEQMIANVSEENVRNEDHYQDISKENNAVLNKGKQRNQNEPSKPRKHIKKVAKSSKKVDKRSKKFGRVNLKNTIQRASEAEAEKTFEQEKYHPVNQHFHAIEEKDTQKVNRVKKTEIPQADSTMGIEKNHPEESPSELKSKLQSPNRSRLKSNSKENGTIEPNDIENIPRIVTTKKEKNEFDQYDNPKYPKSEFVATSGPVILPKIASDEWWKKETEQFKKNKPWI